MKSSAAVALKFCLVLVLCSSTFEITFAQNTVPPSVHVLDNLSGGNGANMTCSFYRKNETDGEFNLLSTQVTDSKGRVVQFIAPADYTPGTYRIWFGTKDYFNAQNVPTFYPAVQVTYKCVDPAVDHHVPLALSPFGFVTYRGG